MALLGQTPRPRGMQTVRTLTTKHTDTSLPGGVCLLKCLRQSYNGRAGTCRFTSVNGWTGGQCEIEVCGHGLSSTLALRGPA
jgi:hypothetical protein